MTERISYADAQGRSETKPILLLDRAFGAALAFFGMVMTLALGPVILAIGIPGLAAFQHPFFSWRLWGLFIWGALWIAPAVIAGWVAGFPSVLAFFSTLWFTVDPPNRQLSRYLWLAILVICVLTGAAFGPI